LTNTIIFIKKCKENDPKEPFKNEKNLVTPHSLSHTLTGNSSHSNSHSKEYLNCFEELENKFQNIDVNFHNSFHYDTKMHQILLSLWKDEKFISIYKEYKYDKHVFDGME
jgi:hypothetical protein